MATSGDKDPKGFIARCVKSDIDQATIVVAALKGDGVLTKVGRGDVLPTYWTRDHADDYNADPTIQGVVRSILTTLWGVNDALNNYVTNWGHIPDQNKVRTELIQRVEVELLPKLQAAYGALSPTPPPQPAPTDLASEVRSLRADVDVILQRLAKLEANRTATG